MILAFLVALLAPPAHPDVCTYKTYEWDVKLRRGTDHRVVSKTRAELGADEKDARDPRCTVCREDQALVEVPGVKPFRVCRHFAPQVRDALRTATAAGFVVDTVVGYRVGRTRGPVSKNKRTVFSNHSYGTAVDINSKTNGMYRRCKLKTPAARAKDVAGCTLGMGGAWDPKRRPKRTIVRGGPLHAAFAPFWKWGGDLSGQLKDFMHFSLTGE